MSKYILVINPGSTSTKLAVFQEERPIMKENISHSAEELKPFARIIDQRELREKAIFNFLKKNSFDLHLLSAVVGRGGLLTPMPSGTYLVTDEMVEYLKNAPLEHASNLGAVLAKDIADTIKINAFIVDPVVVDELDDTARYTGLPQIRRRSIFHALNQKAVAREAARQLNKKYEQCNFVVAHLGGGISIGAHRQGRVIDVNNALNGDGPFSPERAGSLPAWDLIELTLSGRYDRNQLKKMLTGNGGLVAYFGINDMREIEKRYLAGDPQIVPVYEAMCYNIAKFIGSMAVALEGRVDAIVITGGIAYDKNLVELISRKVQFIAPILVIPGEDEMKALALGALRVLNNEEQARFWKQS